MAKSTAFTGFSKDTIKFFDGLRKNNNKDWFEQHRDMYENSVMEPSKAFVLAMGARLRAIAPRIIAVPKVNKSLFRISRDTRFSLNKSPYKTNLGIYFWEGVRPRMECPGFYFHLEPPKMILGAGFYVFPDRLLHLYRRAVVDPRMGKEITKIIEEITRIKGGILGGQHYKRIPAGFDPSHPNARLLLHKGLHFGQETDIPKEFFSSRLVEYCFERYAPCASLHRWLVKVFS
jgi:uncharacterized protein (TIGR02453 family)